MTYLQWFEQHAQKHRLIVNRLLEKGYSTSEIIDYFDFDNMVKEEPDFCLLYQEKKKCHNMKSLNCYLCACPHFRFNDTGISTDEHLTQYSFCDINAKAGTQAQYGEAIHHDCSQCKIPHHRAYVEKNFDLDWSEIMSECAL